MAAPHDPSSHNALACLHALTQAVPPVGMLCSPHVLPSSGSFLLIPRQQVGLEGLSDNSLEWVRAHYIPLGGSAFPLEALIEWLTNCLHNCLMFTVSSARTALVGPVSQNLAQSKSSKIMN